VTEPFDAGWLAAAIALTTPVLFAAMGELVAERTGVINIGLEGMMLMGAFFGFLVMWQSGSPWLGVVTGFGAGAVLAALMAVLTIEARGDQIVVGVGLNILAFGVTTFAYEQIFSSRPQVIIEPMKAVDVPGLRELPLVGKAFFHQAPIAYLAYVAVPLIWYLLYRTSWGLAIRAAGEVPEAVETAGVSVRAVRWLGTLTAGGLAGVGGAFLSVASLGIFVQGMSAGRGFIALAAVIFGRWRPVGVLGACLVFGGADALQLRLQAEEFITRPVWFVVGVVPLLYFAWQIARRRSRDITLGDVLVGGTFALFGIVAFAVQPEWALPSQLWLTLPYAVAILVLAGFGGRTRVPAAIGIPFRRVADA
jgi:simple sugar transport system permease protein